MVLTEDCVAPYSPQVQPDRSACGTKSAMRQSQISRRAHFREPRNSSGEFESFATGLGEIKFLRFCSGRDDQLHALIVKRIDQQNEAFGLIHLSIIQHRNVIDDNGMKFSAIARKSRAPSAAAQRSAK